MLHLYGQLWEHDDVVIVGTRDDLVRLNSAISLLLTSGANRANTGDILTADGEGYAVHIVSVDEKVMENDLPLPYHDKDSKWPNTEPESSRRWGVLCDMIRKEMPCR